jgi:nucleotide-binding universal stress UspA family protein
MLAHILVNAKARGNAPAPEEIAPLDAGQHVGLGIVAKSRSKWRGVNMDYKTILVLCDSSPAAASRIELAHDLAERHGALLSGLHICSHFEPPLLYGAGSAKNELHRTYEALFHAHQERVKSDLSLSSDTFCRVTKGSAVKTDWQVARGVAALDVLQHARCADLVILGQTCPDLPVDGVPADLPEAVALWSGRPTLIVPYAGAPTTPIETAIVCWNASREAARAAADALPILRQARKVVVLTVDAHAASGPDDRDPGADTVAWLARHGVKATAERKEADGDAGRKILSCAADIGADLIVMGAYGRSRMRELALGGVTRTMFRFMTMPVLMAH